MSLVKQMMRSVAQATCAAAFLGLLIGPAPKLNAQALELVNLDDTSAFVESSGWQIVGDAWGLWTDSTVQHEDGAGVILQNGSSKEARTLVTSWEHGDLILELEFLNGRGAQSAIYLQGLYKLHLADSWAVDNPTLEDAGAIAPPAVSPGSVLEGHAPRSNAVKAPGLWQQLRVVFEAPRYGDDGRKVSNARIEEVVLNGVTVQEAVELVGPSNGALEGGEQSAGPLVIVADGALALRNVRIRHFEPVEPVRLTDVRYTKYDGEFSSLDEFRAHEPATSGEAFGYVWDLFGRSADRIGLEWDGTIHIPRTGEYEFAMRFNWIDEIPYEEDAVPGRGRFTIDGTSVIEHEGADSTAFDRIHLERGAYPFTMAYFKNRRLWRPIVFLRVEGPAMPPQYLNAPRTLPQPESTSPPVLVDDLREPYVLRSFAEFDGAKRTNVVSVGDPSGVHYAVDLETGSMLYAWKGAFVDVGSMWTGRGEQQMAVPVGQRIVGSDRPSIVRYQDGGSELAASKLELRTYRLDAEGRPVFEYALGGLAVTDRFEPEGNILRRHLHLKGVKTERDLWIRVAEGRHVRQRADGVYDIDGRYFVDLGTSRRGQLRAFSGGHELVIPVTLDGGSQDVEYEVIW